MKEVKETKEELKEKISNLQEKIETLENDVDYWQKEYNDLDEQLDEVNSQLEELEYYDGIKDIDNFIWRLKLDNLYTKELEKFIENYIKFYN